MDEKLPISASCVSEVERSVHSRRLNSTLSAVLPGEARASLFLCFVAGWKD